MASPSKARAKAMAVERTTDHVGRLKVRRDNPRSEQVIRAMFELWLLQAIEKNSPYKLSRLEITVSDEGE